MQQQPNDAWMTAIVNASSDAVISFALDDTILSWNPAATTMFGYSADEAIGQPMSLLTPPDRADEQRMIRHRLLRAGTINQFESIRVRKNGEHFPTVKTISPVRDATNTIVGAVAIVQDITKRAHIEHALAEQARLLDLSHDAIVVRDVHDRIIYWNHGATELYEWTPEEALGQDLHTLLRTEFEAPFDQMIIALQQRDRMEEEIVQVTRDGRRIHVACRWVLDRDEAGNPGAILTTYNDITARKQADDQIRESEERQAFLLTLNDALRAEPDADAVTNRALQMLFEHMGLDRCYIGVFRLADDRGDFTHQVGNDRVPPVPSAVRLSDFPDALRVAFDRTLVIDDVTETEGMTDTDRRSFGALGMGALVAATVRKGEHTPLWSIVAVSATRRHWTQGEVALIEDVTERTWAAMDRARAEAALRDSEAHYRTLFESMAEGFSVCEAIRDEHGTMVDYRFLQSNRALEKLTGLHPERTVGKRALDVLSGLDTWWFETYQRVIDTQETIRFENYVPQLNRWYDIIAFPFGSERFGTLYDDISERKRSETALHASEVRFRTLTDVVPQVIWANDAEGTANYFNQRWFTYSGKSFEDSFGLGWQVIVHPDDAPASVERWKQALAAGTVFDTEYRLRRADGVYRWHLGRNVPLHDDRGRVTGWFGSATDIHDERLAREAVETALQTRDQFLSIASHELRTPLTSLLGYATLLHSSMSDASPMEQRMTDRIIRQTERLNSLIGQLLDISRLQRGQFAMTAQPLDITHVVAQVVEMTSMVSGAGGSPITFTHPDEPVMIAGDAERLEQVMQNLVSNAVKYSPSGRPIKVVVRTTPTEAIVEITDQGIGIPAEAQARLFEPFYRAANVGTLVSGFGLGLHIVQEIVERHSGRIEVESAEGEGSTFRVLLPLLHP